MVSPSKGRPPINHRKTDLGILCRSKICQSSARACTHKSRWFGNRWLMSALSATAAISRTSVDVSKVAITGLTHRSKYELFDSLVGGDERHVNASTTSDTRQSTVGTHSPSSARAVVSGA